MQQECGVGESMTKWVETMGKFRIRHCPVDIIIRIDGIDVIKYKKSPCSLLLWCGRISALFKCLGSRQTLMLPSRFVTYVEWFFVRRITHNSTILSSSPLDFIFQGQWVCFRGALMRLGTSGSNTSLHSVGKFPMTSNCFGYSSTKSFAFLIRYLVTWFAYCQT